MSYYRLEAKIIGRSGGQSSVAAAAYRSGEKLHDERIDKTFDYKEKKGVERSLILAPAGSADWVFDREKLWNAVEAREDKQNNHATAQLAREVTIDFPRELSKGQRHDLAINFVQNEFVAKGMIADVCFHNTKASDGGEKPHAHIMLTMRDFDGEEFGNKNRSWNTAVFTKDDMIKDKSELVGLRGRYADYVNAALADSGSDVRVSHLTNAENDKEIKHEYQPTAVYQMQQRGKYNEAFFNNLHGKADTIENYHASLKTARGRGLKLGVEDYEYMKARRSVEVDTRADISPPSQAQKTNVQIGAFYHSNDFIQNDRGLDI
jgi:hypothetical protein